MGGGGGGFGCGVGILCGVKGLFWDGCDTVVDGGVNWAGWEGEPPVDLPGGMWNVVWGVIGGMWGGGGVGAGWVVEGGGCGGRVGELGGVW